MPRAQRRIDVTLGALLFVAVILAGFALKLTRPVSAPFAFAFFATLVLLRCGSPSSAGCRGGCAGSGSSPRSSSSCSRSSCWGEPSRSQVLRVLAGANAGRVLDAAAASSSGVRRYLVALTVVGVATAVILANAPDDPP